MRRLEELGRHDEQCQQLLAAAAAQVAAASPHDGNTAAAPARATERPSAEAVWEQLLDEQALRLRAAAEARSGAPPLAPPHAQSGAPLKVLPVKRPGTHILSSPSAQLNGHAARHASAAGLHATADGEQQQPREERPHSQRFLRDFRAWGHDSGQHTSHTAEPVPTGNAPLHACNGAAQHRATAQEAPQPAGVRPPAHNASRAMQAVLSLTEENAQQTQHARMPEQAPVQPARAAGSREGMHAEAQPAAGRAATASERYRTDGSEAYYISRGAWRMWGLQSSTPDVPAAEDSASGPACKHGAAEQQQKAHGEHASAPSSSISWGLYACSYRALQGKLVGEPAKAGADAGAASDVVDSKH